MLGNTQLPFENTLAHRCRHFQGRLVRILSTGCGSDSQPEPNLACLFPCITEGRGDLDLARLPIRDNMEIVDPNRGHGQQFHGVENPSKVPFHPWPRRENFGAARGLTKSQAVDGLVVRIENPDSEQVAGSRSNRIRHIQHKRLLCVFMTADLLPIHPNVGLVIHRLKMQQITALQIGIARGIEGFPIPNQPVITRERFLERARHGGRLGFRPR